MHLLPPFSPPPSPSSSPRKLHTTPSYEHPVEALDPVGTSPMVPGFPLPEQEAPYLHCIETIVPYPSPPQEVRLAKAGCGLSGCREPDTVGVEKKWSGRTKEGEARFGCPVCKTEEVKAEGEFWVEIEAGVALAGDDHAEKGKGKERTKRFCWDGSVGRGSASAQPATGGGARDPLPPPVYTPSSAEIARKDRPGPPSLPTMVIPRVSPLVPTPAPELVPESTSFKSTMGRKGRTKSGGDEGKCRTTLNIVYRDFSIGFERWIAQVLRQTRYEFSPNQTNQSI